MHASNWDVVSICILLAPTEDPMCSLGSERIKESTTVHCGLAFSIARYLRTYMRDAGLSASTHGEWIDVVKSVRLVPTSGASMHFTSQQFMQVLLTQNVGKKGHVEMPVCPFNDLSVDSSKIPSEQQTHGTGISVGPF